MIQETIDRDLAQRLSAAQGALGKLNTEYANKAQGVLTEEQLTRFRDSNAKKQG